jgi:hypothetical protein
MVAPHARTPLNVTGRLAVSSRDLPCTRKNAVHAPMLITISRIFGPLTPARVAPKLAKPACLLDVSRRNLVRALAIGGHEKRIGWAVQLAHEAGLAIVLPRDHWRSVDNGVEHVCRADIDTCAAAYATIGKYQFDHEATRPNRSSPGGSKRVQTLSRPPTSKRRAYSSRRPGASSRKCMPRLSLRARAAA